MQKIMVEKKKQKERNIQKKINKKKIIFSISKKIT